MARLEPHIPSHRVSPRISPSHTNAETANALIGTKICNVCFQGRLINFWKSEEMNHT